MKLKIYEYAKVDIIFIETILVIKKINKLWYLPAT